MKVNDILPRDYNSDSWAPPGRIDCAGYDNPRVAPDYSPRDKRVWLRTCRCVGCPTERCLTMRPDDGEERDVYMGRPFGG